MCVTILELLSSSLQMEQPADFSVRPATTHEAFAALTCTIRLAVSALGFKKVEEILRRLDSAGPVKKELPKRCNQFSVLEPEEDVGPSECDQTETAAPISLKKERWADLMEDED